MRWCCFFVGILLAAVPAHAAEIEHPSCRLAPDLRLRLVDLDLESSSCRDSACLAEREKAARALLAEYPDQAWAARLVQTYEERIATASGSSGALLERYRLAAAAAPRDVTAQYLWGRLEANADPHSSTGLERALVLDGAHPLAQLALAQQRLAAAEPGGPAGAADRKPAAGELIRGFVASCPSRAYLALRLAPQWPQADFWLPLIDSLRATLAERPPLEQAAAALLLWTVEFKLRPVAEHAALRETVAAELALIDKLQLTSSPLYWEALRSGSELTGADPGAIDRRRAEFFPCETASFDVAKSELRKRLGLPADPYQKIEPTPEQRAALLAGYRDLAVRCPHDLLHQIEFFVSLAGDPEATDEELAAVAERVEAVLVLQRGQRRSLRPIGILVAQPLLDRRAAPATTLRLIASARQEFELARAWRQRPESPPVDDRLKAYFAETGGLLDALEARALLQLGRNAEATAVLATAHALLLTPLVPAGDAQKQFAAARKELVAAAPAGPVPPELALPALAAAVKEGLFETVSFEFSGFPLEDPRGRRWQKVDLQGKTWLVNLWATWCGPCMAELPHIQKLHEELKDRQDVGVLTLNFDFVVGKVQPFLDRKAYTFPVLLAGKAFDEKTKDGIPQNWLVDTDLQVRRKAIGFDAENPDAFLALVKEELEAFRKKTR